jgi:hypothetical protein
MRIASVAAFVLNAAVHAAPQGVNLAALEG